MASGALDPFTRECVHLAISASNGYDYCIARHGMAVEAKGMTREMQGEMPALVGVVGIVNGTNRLANAPRVPVDPASED